MKSAHRHQLETNTLAHRLELYIQRYRPYASRIIGGLIAVIALILIASYISGLSAAKQSEAWDSFNLAVTSIPPDLNKIHQAAQEYPGTSMQQLADVTWADSQVFIASRAYLANRTAAMDALDKAVSAYQSVVQSSKDEQLTGRAHLGLARAYEMQNHLDKARDEYRKVTGAYAKYAQQQVERLEKPDAQDTYTWLATAQLPQRKAPVGPGTPGKSPEFSPSEISLPSATGTDAAKADGSKGAAETFENLLKTMQKDGKPGEAPTAKPPGKPEAKSSDGKTPAESKNAPEPKSSAAPPAAGATESTPAATPPATAPPAKDSPAK